MDKIVWAFVGATGGLFCYVLGYVIGEFRGIEKVKQTRGQMEIDEDDEKELKIKHVITEENNSEEN